MPALTDVYQEIAAQSVASANSPSELQDLMTRVPDSQIFQRAWEIIRDRLNPSPGRSLTDHIPPTVNVSEALASTPHQETYQNTRAPVISDIYTEAYPPLEHGTMVSRNHTYDIMTNSPDTTPPTSLFHGVRTRTRTIQGRELFKDQQGSIIAFFPTGSSVICDPPVVSTDTDYVILVDDYRSAVAQLGLLGYVASSDEEYGDDDDSNSGAGTFIAMRHPNNTDNLILVDKLDDFLRWRNATTMAKRFNLTDKADRIMLFRLIRSGGTRL